MSLENPVDPLDLVQGDTDAQQAAKKKKKKKKKRKGSVAEGTGAQEDHQVGQEEEDDEGKRASMISVNGDAAKPTDVPAETESAPVAVESTSNDSTEVVPQTETEAKTEEASVPSTEETPASTEASTEPQVSSGEAETVTNVATEEVSATEITSPAGDEAPTTSAEATSTSTEEVGTESSASSDSGETKADTLSPEDDVAIAAIVSATVDEAINQGISNVEANDDTTSSSSATEVADESQDKRPAALSLEEADQSENKAESTEETKAESATEEAKAPTVREQRRASRIILSPEILAKLASSGRTSGNSGNDSSSSSDGVEETNMDITSQTNRRASVQCVPAVDPVTSIVAGVVVGDNYLFSSATTTPDTSSENNAEAGESNDAPIVEFNAKQLSDDAVLALEKDLAFNYELDGVYGVTVPPLFQGTVKPLIDRLIESSDSGTVLGFGATSQNKTNLLVGNTSTPSKYGLLPAAICYLFEKAQTQKDAKFTFEIEQLEIYSDRVYDLLAPKKTVCPVKENASEFTISGATRKPVTNPSECKLERATQLTSPTQSALLYVVYVHKTDYQEVQDGKPTQRTAVFRFVCLPGSEKADFSVNDSYKPGDPVTPIASALASSPLTGSSSRGSLTASDRIAQRGLMLAHQSLFALDRVVRALNADATAVPYHESTLTKVLKGALGESARCVFIAVVSSAPSDALETISTLKFASRAKLTYALPDTRPIDPHEGAVVNALFDKTYVPLSGMLPFTGGAAPTVDEDAPVTPAAVGAVAKHLAAVAADDDDEDDKTKDIEVEDTSLRRRASRVSIMSTDGSPLASETPEQENARLRERVKKLKIELAKAAKLLEANKDEVESATKKVEEAQGALQAKDAELKEVKESEEKAKEEVKRQTERANQAEARLQQAQANAGGQESKASNDYAITLGASPSGSQAWHFKLGTLSISGAKNFSKPVLLISVVDESGIVLSRQVMTPPSDQVDAKGITFDAHVSITKPSRNSRSAYLFVEFKHYKAAVSKYSCKCFAFGELPSLASGQQGPTLQMNAKPTDFQRKIVKKFNASLSFTAQ